MEVVAGIWWKHNNKSGQYSSAAVHRSFSVRKKDEVSEPKDIEGYILECKKLDGLEPCVFVGENIVKII
jgi:CRISPR-associated protein Csd2